MAYLEKTVSDYESLTAALPATGTSFRVEAPNSDDENVSTKFASTLYSSTGERNFKESMERCAASLQGIAKIDTLAIYYITAQAVQGEGLACRASPTHFVLGKV